MLNKKEMRNEYKEKVFPAGVFAMVNTIRNKMFVAGSFDLIASENRCRFELKMGTHRNKELQADWKMDGEESFEYRILSSLEKKDDNEITRKDLKVLKELLLQELADSVELY